MSRALTRIALVVLAGALTACWDDGGRRTANDPAVRASAVPVRAASPADEARRFTGRVPRLRGTPRPADTLRMVRAYGDTSMFGSPTAVRRAGEMLVVADRFMDPHLSVFDAASGRLVQRIGRHGKGPREMQDPLWFQPDSADPARAWVYDFAARRFSLLDPANERRPVVREVSLDAGVSLMNPVWNGDRIIANGLLPDYTLLVVDGDGRPVERLAADPPFTERQMPHATGRRLLNRSFLAANPSRTRLALAYQWKSRIDFFTVGGERVGSIPGPRQTRPVFHVANNRFFWGPDDENEMAYWAVDATDRYVYALFCGCLAGKGHMPALLHVFDWSGNFVAEIALDRQLTSLDVSDDDRVLYATFEAPHPGVGEWTLPSWVPSPGSGVAAAGTRRVPPMNAGAGASGTTFQ